MRPKHKLHTQIDMKNGLVNKTTQSGIEWKSEIATIHIECVYSIDVSIQWDVQKLENINKTQCERLGPFPCENLDLNQIHARMSEMLNRQMNAHTSNL